MAKNVCKYASHRKAGNTRYDLRQIFRVESIFSFFMHRLFYKGMEGGIWLTHNNKGKTIEDAAFVNFAPKSEKLVQ